MLNIKEMEKLNRKDIDEEEDPFTNPTTTVTKKA